MKTNLLVIGLIVALASFLSTEAAAQTYVTPTLQTTPGNHQVTTVNNGPGNHTDPHVDGNLVSYTDQTTAVLTTIRYHNLTAGTDNGVPAGFGSQDFLSDVRGSMIVFTRSAAEAGIFTFDTATSTLTEISPRPGSFRFGAQIGDQTIVWQEFSRTVTSSAIVAYDRTTLGTTVLSPAAQVVNQNLGISPDGSVVGWEACTAIASCKIWEAVRSSNGIWTSHQLVSQVQGAQSHPDTDGTIIAYSANFPNGSGVVTDRIVWQPVAGGTEHVLDLPGSAINPGVSHGWITFDYDAQGTGVHQIYLYNVAANVLYNVTGDLLPGDTHHKTLTDISITPDGTVRVVWQVLVPLIGWNIYAYTFTVAPEVYVTDAGASSVSVIDSSSNTVVATIPVGAVPVGVATVGGLVYVTNSRDGTVSVIDANTHTVIGSPIAVGRIPTAIAMVGTSAGTRAYVTNSGANTVSVIDTATSTVVGTPIPVGPGPAGIAVHQPIGGQAVLYITNSAGSTVSVIDSATNTVVNSIHVPFAPEDVAFTHDGKHAYVTSLSGYLTIIDTSSQSVVGAPIFLGAISTPNRIAMTPDGTQAYVMEVLPRKIVVIDLTTNTAVGSIATGHIPTEVAFTNATHGYVTNIDAKTVSIIDTASRTVIGSPIPVGSLPVGVAVAFPFVPSLFFICPPSSCP